jgi:hypothetical protein
MHLKDMHARRDVNSPWVFPSPRPPEEGPRYFANPQKLLDEVKADAEMSDFKFHDLRHFFASFSVMSGIDTLTVASWLGHADGGVLLAKIYSHLDPKHKRESAAKIRFTPQETVAQNTNLITLDLSKMSAADLLALLQRQSACGNTGSDGLNMNVGQSVGQASLKPQKMVPAAGIEPATKGL